MVGTFLEREDDRMDVLPAISPENGRKILHEREVAYIVSDYELPHSNCIEFPEAVREEHPDLPLIRYTGK